MLNRTVVKFNFTTEILRQNQLQKTHHYGILYIFPYILDFLFLFSIWRQDEKQVSSC